MQLPLKRRRSVLYVLPRRHAGQVFQRQVLPRFAQFAVLPAGKNGQPRQRPGSLKGHRGARLDDLLVPIFQLLWIHVTFPPAPQQAVPVPQGGLEPLQRL